MSFRFISQGDQSSCWFHFNPSIPTICHRLHLTPIMSSENYLSEHCQASSDMIILYISIYFTSAQQLHESAFQICPVLHTNNTGRIFNWSNSAAVGRMLVLITVRIQNSDDQIFFKMFDQRIVDFGLRNKIVCVLHSNYTVVQI